MLIVRLCGNRGSQKLNKLNVDVSPYTVCESRLTVYILAVTGIVQLLIDNVLLKRFKGSTCRTDIFGVDQLTLQQGRLTPVWEEMLKQG